LRTGNEIVLDKNRRRAKYLKAGRPESREESSKLKNRSQKTDVGCQKEQESSKL